jgi:hypothetical protein
MKEAFEKMTGMPDAWTNPALMVSRNAFIQGWEARAEQPAYVQQEYERVVYQCPRCATSMQVDLTAATALAQPAQEPVSFKIYRRTSPRHAIPNVQDGELPWVYDQDPSTGNVASMWVTPVKATPQQRPWVDLTDDEVREHEFTCTTRREYARAIEAKLKEKNNG